MDFIALQVFPGGLKSRSCSIMFHPGKPLTLRCVRFASRSNVAFTFDLSKSNAGEYFQLLKMNALLFDGHSNMLR